MSEISLENIKKYMEENKIDNNIDSYAFRKSLGILKIYKDERRYDGMIIIQERYWEIRMLGPKNSPYEEGVFEITLDFGHHELNGEIPKPKVRFKNRIYHLNADPSTGHISVTFLNNYNKMSFAEILVGIYLFFFNQNPYSSFSTEMAREYQKDRAKFNIKVREWINKYASQTIIDLILINNNKLDELETKYNLLVEHVKKMKISPNLNSNNTMELVKELKSNTHNEILAGEKLISVIFQSEKEDVLCSIICKDTDVFVNVECSLYNKYPKFLETEQYFLVKGKKVNKYKTLKENGIKDSDIILLYQINQNQI